MEIPALSNHAFVFRFKLWLYVALPSSLFHLYLNDLNVSCVLLKYFLTQIFCVCVVLSNNLSDVMNLSDLFRRTGLLEILLPYMCEARREEDVRCFVVISDLLMIHFPD